MTSDGETTRFVPAFDAGLLTGILVGEGHFGGDGKQPHITLRMHTRHRSLFEWLVQTFPGGRLYGPYHHGGRSYYQWMARGEFLRRVLVPILDTHLTEEIDQYAFERYVEMKMRYRIGQSSTRETTTERFGSSPSE